ncbi:HAMP domain-containing protein, partial [Rhizobium ruizarguesonis]
VAVAAVALLISAFTAFWIASTISNGLSRANTVVREVSEGDLTKMADITSHDEIGDLLGDRAHGVDGARHRFTAHLRILGRGTADL